MGFGLSVLRAETAAVTAGALLASLRTGTVAAVDGSSAGVTAAHGHGNDPGTGKFVPVIRLQQKGADPGA